MSLASVHKKLEALADTPSTLDKKCLLEQSLQDDLFLKVIQYALDPRKKFKVKKFPPFKQKTNGKVKSIFTCLDKLSESRGASNQDKELLYHLASIDENTYEVVKRICNGDLRCGCGERLINTVRPNTVPFTPYLRCSTIKHIKNICYPAIWQEKANGAYAEMHVIVNEKKQIIKIKFKTRDGHKLHSLGHLKKAVKKAMGGQYPKSTVFCGELRVWNSDGTIMDRQTGNGVVNQCVQGTVSKENAKNVFFSMWDAVPLTDYLDERCYTPYKARFAEASKLRALIDNNALFRVIKNFIVNSFEEAQELTNDEIAKGNEGGVLKNLLATWKNGTSSDQIKLKGRFECELRAVAWENGDKGKKHANVMGRVVFETDDGKVRTAVGTGFSDRERAEDWDKHIGRIGEIEYESVSKSKSRGVGIYALYGPASFVCWRDDKDKTDTVEELLGR